MKGHAGTPTAREDPPAFPTVSQDTGAEDYEREVACSMTTVLLRMVRRAGGDAAVASLLQSAGAKHETGYLEQPDNWISLAESTALLHAGIEHMGDPQLARRVGENILRQHAGTQVATMLRSLGSTEKVLEAVTDTASRLSAVTRMEPIETRPGHAVVRALVREGFTRLPVHCELTAGVLSATPMLFGLPLAEVQESECVTRGDPHCLYAVSWDAQLAAAAADPEQRVTALEAQLVAMSERLQSVYATARELISTTDLDALLRHIVERAAQAVRAPSHILAVRTAPSAELQVYGHGIDAARARALARAALAADVRGTRAADVRGTRAADVRGTPEDDSGEGGLQSPPDSLLVVDVKTGRRSYGKLIARYPGGASFFPQERELLNLYAQHAAAALDMATALEESARRNEQVSSLLGLAHAVAQAGASDEIAKRLAAAVAQVVDCDRIGVWLWDPARGELRSTASWGRTAAQEEFLTGIALTPERMPALRRLIEEQEPLFFELGTDEPTVAELMETLGVVAVAVIPIVVRETFLGSLMVSVRERPERLRTDGEWPEHLTGVAALAATALQNGQLIDKLNHRALHDALTGVLNRVGFREHIDAMLERAAPNGREAGLLFIDLDGFKRVNDSYGHDAGDEVLRKAAARLTAVTRATDAVARLGGDEFAVVLADCERGPLAGEQVRAAVERVRAAFSKPFAVGEEVIVVGASVGGGLWPEHGRTVADLVRHADAEMYADKVKARTSERRAGERGALVSRSR